MWLLGDLTELRGISSNTDIDGENNNVGRPDKTDVLAKKEPREDRPIVSTEGLPSSHNNHCSLTRRLSCIFARSTSEFAAPHPPKAEPTPRLDPLGRDTPRSSLIGFLKHESNGDYATAARYLQLAPGQDTDLAQLAKELRTLYPSFQGNINLLSDDPNGNVEAGLPLGQVRAGVVDGRWQDCRPYPGAGGRSCCRKDLAGLADDSGEYTESLRSAGERSANAS